MHRPVASRKSTQPVDAQQASRYPSRPIPGCARQLGDLPAVPVHLGCRNDTPALYLEAARPVTRTLIIGAPIHALPVQRHAVRPNPLISPEIDQDVPRSRSAMPAALQMAYTVYNHTHGAIMQSTTPHTSLIDTSEHFTPDLLPLIVL